MVTRGHHHDLQRLYDALNAVYFDGAIAEIPIGWSPSRQLKSGVRKRFVLGWYHPEPPRIAIHPVLDNRWVPQYFLMFVVFHEMLHAVYPPEIIDGVLVWHTQSFLEAELRFVHRERALAWEVKHMERLHRAQSLPRPPREVDHDEEG